MFYHSIITASIFSARSATQQQHTPLQHYKIISAYRKKKNLKDLLVTSTFSRKPTQPPLPITHHFKPHKSITNPHSHTTLPILHPPSIDSPNIVYIITCTHCHKHYIGETKHTMITRLKQHLYTFKQQHLQTTLVQHFSLHPITHLTIASLESIRHHHINITQHTATYSNLHPPHMHNPLLHNTPTPCYTVQ